jgi:hypothetical protein
MEVPEQLNRQPTIQMLMFSQVRPSHRSPTHHHRRVVTSNAALVKLKRNKIAIPQPRIEHSPSVEASESVKVSLRQALARARRLLMARARKLPLALNLTLAVLVLLQVDKYVSPSQQLEHEEA